MRKLVIARGPQGSGKSGVLAAAGLGDHILSPDIFRKAMFGPALNYEGDPILNQEDNADIWKAVMDSLDRRMEKAETIAFEATLPDRKDIDEIIRRARANRYEILVLDLYNAPIERVKAENAKRGSLHYVRETSIDKVYAAYVPHDETLPTVRWDESFDVMVRQVRDFRQVPLHDFSGWSRIVHIGDIQGVFKALHAEGSPLHGGLRDDALYIFTGDALDRGIENGEVMRWILDEIAPRMADGRAHFIRGNHEVHLERYALGEESESGEFNDHTAPQLRAAGISGADIEPFLANLVDLVAYRRGREHVIVTHGGLPKVPDAIGLVPGRQLMKGTRHYSDPVDEQFGRWSLEHEAAHGARWWQVHGHRNRQMFPTRASERSFNLEGQPDFGGHVRFVTLDDAGWTTADVRNTVMRDAHSWHVINAAKGKKTSWPTAPDAPWVMRGDKARSFTQEEMDSFTAHEFVAERTSETMPHISSISFTKDAFHKKAWDDVVNKARGLFVSRDDMTVVSRSYPKFFNMGERADNGMPTVTSEWTYPMHAYLKENGFLGIAGYDARTGSLLLSSKSSLDGDFAAIFRDIAHATLGDDGIERLLRLVRDQEASAIFEVIDPVRDPHIIEYETPRIVLLDLVWRSPDFERMPYDDLVKLGRYLGIETKQRMFIAHNPQTIESQVMLMQDPARGRHKGKPVEGFVLEDAEGRIVKVKGGYYGKWKHARSLVEREALSRRTGRPFNREIPETLEAFMAWIRLQADDALELPIITLRAHYDSDPGQVLPSSLPPPVPKRRDMSGYRKGLDAMVTQITAGKANGKSIAKLIEAAKTDQDKMDVLRNHPDIDALIRNAQDESPTN